MVPLVAGCGVLAALSLVLGSPPASPRPAAQAVADRVERLLDGPGGPAELHPLTALARSHSRDDHGEVRTVEYTCDSAHEVRAVAVTDVTGDRVYRALPVDGHHISLDGAAPVLRCDGRPQELLALLVARGDAGAAASPAPQQVLIMTRTAPAGRPTAIEPGSPPRGRAVAAVEQSWLHRYPYPTGRDPRPRPSPAGPGPTHRSLSR